METWNKESKKIHASLPPPSQSNSLLEIDSNSFEIPLITKVKKKKKTAKSYMVIMNQKEIMMVSDDQVTPINSKCSCVSSNLHVPRQWALWQTG